MLGSEWGQEKNSSCELVERIKSSVRSYNQFIFFFSRTLKLKACQERKITYLDLP